MARDQHDFTPENVDDQIDRLAQATSSPETLRSPSAENISELDQTNVRIVQALHSIYQSDATAEDTLSLARIQRRINARYTPTSENSLQRMTGQGGMFRTAPLALPRHLRRSTSSRWLGAIAAIVILSLLATGLLLLTHILPILDPATPAHQTPLPSVQNNIYVLQNNGLTKLDQKTGKQLWTYPMPETGSTPETATPFALTVLNGSVYVVWPYKVYAINANTGQMSWTRQFTPAEAVATPPLDAISKAVVANGILYYLRNNGSLAALDLANNKDLWYSSLAFSPNSQFVVNQDTLYVLNNDDFRLYALNSANGKERWHFDAETNALPLDQPYILPGNGMVYESQSGMLYALNADGTKRWEKPLLSPASAQTFNHNAIFLNHDILYYEVDIDSNRANAVISAYNAFTGAELWHTNPGEYMLNEQQQITAAGQLIVQRLQPPDEGATEVLDLQKGPAAGPLWSSRNLCTGCIVSWAGSVAGKIYVIAEQGQQIPTLYTIDASSGKTLAQTPTNLLPLASFNTSYPGNNTLCILSYSRLDANQPAILSVFHFADKATISEYSLPDNTSITTFMVVLAP